MGFAAVESLQLPINMKLRSHCRISDFDMVIPFGREDSPLQLPKIVPMARWYSIKMNPFLTRGTSLINNFVNRDVLQSVQIECASSTTLCDRVAIKYVYNFAIPRVFYSLAFSADCTLTPVILLVSGTKVRCLFRRHSPTSLIYLTMGNKLVTAGVTCIWLSNCRRFVD